MWRPSSLVKRKAAGPVSQPVRLVSTKGEIEMRKCLIAVAALAAAATSVPAWAQQSAMKPGPLWTAARIEVMDGQMQNYQDWLAKTWIANQEFAKSQGWLLEYHILSSVNPRDGEPNIILLTRFNDFPSAAEVERRNALMAQHTGQDAHQAAAASGQRNPMRKQMGSVLYRELVKR